MKKLLSLSVLMFVVGCNGGKNKPNIELIQDMMDQVSVKAQDWDPSAPDNRANRYPPENTNPIGHKVVPYANDPQLAGEKLINPLAGNFSPEVISLGKAKYDIYCAVCHGDTMHGDGPVAPKMTVIKPPSLLSDKVKGYKDGRIFHVITFGQGVMGNYATQLHDQKQRWAIVNYVRMMQKKAE